MSTSPTAEIASDPTVIDIILGHVYDGTRGTSHDDPDGIRIVCTCRDWSQNIAGMQGVTTWRLAHAEHVRAELAQHGLLADQPTAAEEQPETCEMVHEEPYDFASCLTHDTTFALGDACKFNGRLMWEVYADEADEQRQLKVRAEMEAEQASLDLDVLRGAVRSVLDEHPVSTAAAAEKIKPLLSADADPLRDAQRAAWSFGHKASQRGLGEDTNPF